MDEKESKMQGITVKLVNEDGEKIQETTTDNDGKYSFSGIEKGNYCVVIDPGEKYVVTAKNVDTDSEKNSKINLDTFNTDLITDFDTDEMKTIKVLNQNAGFIPKEIEIKVTKIWAEEKEEQPEKIKVILKDGDNIVIAKNMDQVNIFI